MQPDSRGYGAAAVAGGGARRGSQQSFRPSQRPHCSVSQLSGGSRNKVFDAYSVLLDFAAVEPREAERDLPAPK